MYRKLDSEKKPTALSVKSKLHIRKYLILVILIAGVSPILICQTESEMSHEDWENAKENLDFPYSGDQEGSVSISDEDWEKSKGDLDYPEKTKKPEKEEKVEDEAIEDNDDSIGFFDKMGDFFKNLGPLGKVLFLSIVILGLAALIMKLIGNTPWQARKKIRRGQAYSIEELDEHIHETDLEKYLREAIEKNNFRAAIRIYYLIVIKSMSEQGRIKWQRDKTNYDYVREVRKSPFYRQFRDLTHVFEVIWYGEADVDSSTYQKLVPSFNKFIAGLSEE